MSRVLVTGMSGAGKSTLLRALDERGHPTVDTDEAGWKLADGTWDEGSMTDLLADRVDIVVSGTVENQGRFYDRFEHVVLLTAPLEVLLERTATRTTNGYGKSAAERAEIIEYIAAVEPLLERGATLILDSRQPLEQLADTIARLLSP